MLWILLSLNAALFYALRYVIVKKYLSGVNTYLLAFTARTAGFLCLLPFLFFQKISIKDPYLFWQTIAITSILTAIASIMQLHSIKNYDLSSSVPFLSFVPLFMVMSVLVIFRELPGESTVPGIILLCIGGYVINLKSGSSFLIPLQTMLKNRGGLLFFGVAVIYGLTTTLDRMAIDDAGSSGFSYSLLWNMFSLFLFSFIFIKPKNRREHLRELRMNYLPIIIQGVFSIIAFFSQMLAIEIAKGLEANVIYIKALTLLQLFIGVLFGIYVFKEEHPMYRLSGSILMIAGAVVIILSLSI